MILCSEIMISTKLCTFRTSFWFVLRIYTHYCVAFTGSFARRNLVSKSDEHFIRVTAEIIKAGYLLYPHEVDMVRMWWGLGTHRAQLTFCLTAGQLNSPPALSQFTMYAFSRTKPVFE